jgi:hypothetical protein
MSNFIFHIFLKLRKIISNFIQNKGITGDQCQKDFPLNFFLLIAWSYLGFQTVFFFERKCGRGSPYSDFVFFENKNPNSHLWRLEPEWLGCTSTSLTKWARLTSWFQTVCPCCQVSCIVFHGVVYLRILLEIKRIGDPLVVSIYTKNKILRFVNSFTPAALP